MHVEILDRPDAFFALREEWRTLLAESAHDHLYLTHEFLSAWWKNLSGSSSLRLILVRDAGRLLGVAPMILRRSQLLRFPVRKLEFMGSGLGYGGFILSGQKGECLARIMAVLQEVKGWDVIYLSNMLADPDLESSHLAGLVNPNRGVHEAVRVAVPYIPLQTTWDEYLAGRSPAFRRNMRNRSRKLKALGRVRFQRIRRLEEAGTDVLTLMGWLRAIADRSWKADKQTAISSDPHVFAFYSDLVEQLNEGGYLDVSLLWLDERPVAYIFGATYNRDFLEIDIAFDTELSKASPGVFLRNQLLEELFQQDYRIYDFVAYFDYKKELTSHVRAHDVHVIYRRSVYPLALRWLRAVVRRWMPRVMADYSDLSWGDIPSAEHETQNTNSGVSSPRPRWSRYQPLSTSYREVEDSHADELKLSDV